MCTNFSRAVSFVTSTTEVSTHTVFTAIQYCFDRVVDTTQVRSLDLSHVTSLSLSEVDNVFECVTPFVSYDFSVRALSFQCSTDSSQSFDLSLLFTHIYWTFYTEVERLSDLSQTSDVFSDSFEIVVEYQAQSTVYVDVENRVIVFKRLLVQYAVAEPFDVSFNLFALQTYLFFYVVEQSVWQYSSTLHDHLVSVHVTVVTRLSEDRNHSFAYLCAIFFGNDFCHDLVLALSNSIQTSLSHTVTDSGMINLTSRRRNHLVYDVCHFTEVSDFTTFVQRSDFLFDYWNEVFCKEQWVTTTCTRVLYSCAIAECYLSVFEYEHYRNRFTHLSY